MDTPNSGISGSNEPTWDHEATIDGGVTWQAAVNELSGRPMYYNRDGTPVQGDNRQDAMLNWANKFERQDRTVAVTKTLYGERLSTVFLGLDHSFSQLGPPIIFETMLFAPQSAALKLAIRDRLGKVSASLMAKDPNAIEEMETFAEEERIKGNYPHDQLQERYATEAQAKAGHNKLKLQCLIPPRWRRFLLYTLGRDERWS